MPRTLTDAEREARYVDRRGDDECWPWRGAHTPAGYSIFTHERRNEYGHRWMHVRYNGPIPAGHVVDHTCHDPNACPGGKTCPHRGCCNPRHMSAIPKSDNTKKGRSHNRWTSNSRTQGMAS